MLSEAVILRFGVDWITPARPEAFYGLLERPGALERPAVIPGHPVLGVRLERSGVSLDLSELVEGVRAGELRGVNETHEEIADARDALRLVE